MLTTTRRIARLAAKGAKARVSRIVVQFGLAITPLWAKAASGLTSGTTSGTPSSIRKALELSTITAPAAVIASRHCLETEPPADASTRSTPSKDWAETSSTVRVRPFQVWVWPAERADASSFSSPTGKRRSSSSSSSSWPTAPLAPRTATLRGRLGRVEDKRWSERSERKPVVSQIRHHCVENVMPIERRAQLTDPA